MEVQRLQRVQRISERTTRADRRVRYLDKPAEQYLNATRRTDE